jgi:pimeloyl-ACP methyl ester carboxylesterase
MAYDALKVIRPFVKIGSYFAPRLTGNLAFRLFCFPPKAGNLNETQKKLIVRAEARLADAERLRVPLNKGWVETYRFPTTQAVSQGTVLLLHGWTSRAAFMTAFIEPLQSNGFDVLVIDLPGHGLSSGRELNVALGVAALHAVQSKFGAWYGIIAHSFGGAVATSFVSGAIKPYPAISVNRLALIATPNSIPDLFQWFGNAIGLTRKGQESFNANVLKLSGNTLDFFIGENLLRQAGIKTLVLHAPDDKEVTYSNAEGLAAAGSHVTLQPMPGLGHRRILYAPSTVSAVLPFLKAD